MFIAAVDQHRQLHSSRPAKIDQLIHRGTYRPPGVQHIIDQHDGSSFNVTRQLRTADDRLSAHRRKIVAVQSDIQDADRRSDAFELRDLIGDPVSQRHTTTPNADQNQLVDAMIFFDYFRSETGERAVDARRIHDAGLFSEFHRRKILTRIETRHKRKCGDRSSYYCVAALQSSCAASTAVQLNCGSSLATTRFLVPEFHALDDPIVAAQIERTRRAAGIDALGKLQLFISAIAEMNYHAFENHRRLLHANLQLPESPFFTADRNFVVVIVTINMLIAQKAPAVLRARPLGDQTDEQRNQ